MTFYEQALQQRTYLADQIKHEQKLLLRLPKGHLAFSKSGNFQKWYQVIPAAENENRNENNTAKGRQARKSKRIYIPRTNRKLAQALAAKCLHLTRIEYLNKELDALNYFIDHHASDDEFQFILRRMPECSELVSPEFFTEEDEKSKKIAAWINEPYESLTKRPEDKKCGALNGMMMRSKSEVMIADRLYLKGIPFRYEMQLAFPEMTCYPDFTILHPRTGKIFYWEHFGNMDDMAYAQNSSLKIASYAHHDILPDVNLITTYETRNIPLSSTCIESKIKYFFEEN